MKKVKTTVKPVLCDLQPVLVIFQGVIEIGSHTARTARFSKKSLRSDVGEIKKMSEKFKKKSVLTPQNVREKSNAVIYYKTPTLTIKRREIKKWDINL
jgi:hypothetical protein